MAALEAATQQARERAPDKDSRGVAEDAEKKEKTPRTPRQVSSATWLDAQHQYAGIAHRRQQQIHGQTDHELSRRIVVTLYKMKDAIQDVRTPALFSSEMPDPPSEKRKSMSADQIRFFGVSQSHKRDESNRDFEFCFCDFRRDEGKIRRFLKRPWYSAFISTLAPIPLRLSWTASKLL